MTIVKFTLMIHYMLLRTVQKINSPKTQKLQPERGLPLMNCNPEKLGNLRNIIILMCNFSVNIFKNLFFSIRPYKTIINYFGKD